MLLRLGYEIDAVNNGLEVLQASKRMRYVLVLMDIVMPMMDGITATQEIHRRFPASELPWIIAFMAYDHSNIRAKCLEAGKDNITKPVTLNELRVMLMKYVGQPGRHILNV